MSEKINRIIADLGVKLEKVGIEAGRIEVEMVLCHVLEVDRLNLYLHGEKFLNDERLERINQIVERRTSRFPLQYILGEMWFYGRRFDVDQSVMIPTPETELLCERAVTFVRNRKLVAPTILDIGTGSGVIAITMASELKDANVTAVDISDEALKTAMANAKQLGVSERVKFLRSDLLSSIADGTKFDLILSNPPYICETVYDGLPPEVLADPKVAITSGDDGMDAIRVIVDKSPDFLKLDGRLLFEIGYDQAMKVAELTEGDNRYRSIDIFRDYNDIDRIVMLAPSG